MSSPEGLRLLPSVPLDPDLAFEDGPFADLGTPEFDDSRLLVDCEGDRVYAIPTTTGRVRVHGVSASGSSLGSAIPPPTFPDGGVIWQIWFFDWKWSSFAVFGLAANDESGRTGTGRRSSRRDDR